MKVRRLKYREDFEQYAFDFNSICNSRIPWYYFSNSQTWGLFDSDGLLRGGFTIVDGDQKLRVLNQLPTFFWAIWEKNVSELTGYFIKGNKGRLKLKTMFFLQCLLHKKNKFIYSYDKENQKLENYYSYGNPIRIFSGYLNYDEPVFSFKEENVEIITKFGIFLILLKSTFKKIFK